ncbi:MAG TPA: D-alanyl-D-alanine carboxypeptidase [Xanthobacteraceae bacterium]|nr:D-alanyl-D-alanine carboxypeptidase [Xanthobacteraceae bacterium]
MFGLVAVVTVLAVATEPVDARRHRRSAHGPGHISQSSRGDYSPPYSAIVVDANTGKILHEASADSPRHPASLTKIMTLYLLFERLESGKMKLNTSMPVSEHASVQAPTKLGLRPGQNLEVEDAIRGLVTKSANDAAVVVAEAIGGSEDDFAAMMTSKARALGMSRTIYRNASGLPDDDQITTARDQALLGRAIQERFPRYYRYFSTPSFTYRGESMRNHNHLLGQVEGVDGIKTGYTRASGFNLVTSVSRDNRHLVAVVLGGSSAASRDARMRGLISQHFAETSSRRTATMVAESNAPTAPAEPRAPARPAQVAAAGGAYALASATSVPVPPPAAPAAAAPVQGALMVASKPHVVAGSSEPLKPIAVKTIKVKLAGVETPALAPSATMIAVPEETGSTPPPPKAAAPQPAAAAPPAPAVQPWSTQNKEPIKSAAWPSAPAVAPAPEPVAVTKHQAVAKAEPAPPAKTAKAEPVAPARKPQTHTGWIIQIGAFETAGEAKQRLDAAQSKAKSVLGRADAFTEPVTKGDKTFYRARFAGLEKSQAEATCKQLKRNDITCMALKN